MIFPLSVQKRVLNIPRKFKFVKKLLLNFCGFETEVQDHIPTNFIPRGNKQCLSPWFSFEVFKVKVWKELGTKFALGVDSVLRLKSNYNFC